MINIYCRIENFRMDSRDAESFRFLKLPTNTNFAHVIDAWCRHWGIDLLDCGFTVYDSRAYWAKHRELWLSQVIEAEEEREGEEGVL